MRSIISYIILFLLISLTWTCSEEKCGDVYCPAFNPQHLSLIPYNEGDTMTFKNDSGRVIQFVVETKYADNAKISPCQSSTCNCVCDPWATMGGTSTGVEKYMLSIGIFDAKPSLNEPLSLLLFLDNSTSSFLLSPIRIKPFRQRLFESITFGDKKFNDVIEDNIPFPDNNVISKTYVSSRHGLIAFFDVASHSLFYIE